MSDAASPLLSVVSRVLADDGWPSHRLADRTVISTSVSADGLEWSCFARTLEDEEQFAFYSVLPVEVPPERRQAVCELITRANYGLVLGNFELDFTDGELRFKTSIDVEGDELSDALVRTLLYANVAVTRRYLPAVKAVVNFGVEPAAAAAEVEG